MHKFLVVSSDTRFGRFQVGEVVSGIQSPGIVGIECIELTRSPKLIVGRGGDGFYYASGVTGLKLKLIKVVKPKLKKRDNADFRMWQRSKYDKRVRRRFVRQVMKDI